jgi:hypothetical protein
MLWWHRHWPRAHGFCRVFRNLPSFGNGLGSIACVLNGFNDR